MNSGRPNRSRLIDEQFQAPESLDPDYFKTLSSKGNQVKSNTFDENSNIDNSSLSSDDEGDNFLNSKWTKSITGLFQDKSHHKKVIPLNTNLSAKIAGVENHYNRLTKQSDVWSFGMILYLLFIGKLPTSVKLQQVQSVGYFQGMIWSKIKCSYNLQDLLMKSLHPNPQLRITSDKILSHPFYATYNASFTASPSELPHQPKLPASTTNSSGPAGRNNLSFLLSKVVTYRPTPVPSKLPANNSNGSNNPLQQDSQSESPTTSDKGPEVTALHQIQEDEIEEEEEIEKKESNFSEPRGQDKYKLSKDIEEEVDSEDCEGEEDDDEFNNEVVIKPSTVQRDQPISDLTNDRLEKFLTDRENQNLYGFCYIVFTSPMGFHKSGRYKQEKNVTNVGGGINIANQTK
jgi:serine/threonine protein kinase